MPGRSADSRPHRAAGLAVAAVAVVGALALGWQFGGNDPVPTAVGVGVAAVAVAWTLYARLAGPG